MTCNEEADAFTNGPVLLKARKARYSASRELTEDAALSPGDLDFEGLVYGIAGIGFLILAMRALSRPKKVYSSKRRR